MIMTLKLQENDKKDYLKWTTFWFKNQAALLSLLSLNK